MPFGSAPRSRRPWTVRPGRVVVLAINWTIAWWVSRGLPRQFWVMKANSRCSIRFHLLVPGGRWATVTRQPGLVGEALQLALPQPDPHAVAAAAVGGDQQPCGGGVAGPAEVGVACALAGLAVGLQAEAEPAQQSADQLLAGGEAALGQRASEVAYKQAGLRLHRRTSLR